MKNHLILTLGLLLASIVPAIGAQNPPGANDPKIIKNDEMSLEYGPRMGEHEFTLGGNGSSDKNLNRPLGGVAFSDQCVL